MTASSTLHEGDVVADRYRVLRVLGGGGSGTVYAAEHTWTRREVALKVIAPEGGASEVVSARFFREARALSTLRHPHVVQVLDMGQDESDGALFLAQELLVGEDLRARLSERGPVGYAQAARWLCPIADALAHAHEAGILHRDVKPANIFLARADDDEGATRPLLIDFGVARPIERDPASTLQTEHGLPVGTPRYMAPEQVRGDVDLDSRVDVWSLGAVLFECVTGRPAFDAPSAATLYAQILTGRPPSAKQLNAELPTAFGALIDRALAFERADRFPSMAALRDALARFTDAPGAGASLPWEGLATPRVRLALAGLALALGLAVTARLLAPSAPDRTPRPSAPATASLAPLAAPAPAAAPAAPRAHPAAAADEPSPRALAPVAAPRPGRARRPVTPVPAPGPAREPPGQEAAARPATAPRSWLVPVEPEVPRRGALDPVEP